jgi:hypothetical protein
MTLVDETFTLGSLGLLIMLKLASELATAVVPVANRPVPKATTVIFLIKSLRCVCMIIKEVSGYTSDVRFEITRFGRKFWVDWIDMGSNFPFQFEAEI